MSIKYNVDISQNTGYNYNGSYSQYNSLTTYNLNDHYNISDVNNVSYSMVVDGKMTGNVSTAVNNTQLFLLVLHQIMI